MAGKRMQGRPSPSVVNRGLLFKRIREVEPVVDTYDVGAVVACLRELYHDYRSKKLQPFTHCVQQALEEHCHHPRRRQQGKHREGWPGEEEVLLEGTQPPPSPGSSRGLKRLRRPLVSPARSSSTPTSSTSSPSSAPAEWEDGDDDAVFEAKVEPEFDLTKSALRERYGKGGQPPTDGCGGKVEADLQEENALDSKLRRTAELVGRTAVASSVPPVRGETGGGEVVVGKGRDGPRFRDFGGIKGVLEELMMEVLVPLYHPHLPRMLGVRPMAGILLHGPPGCGKTKLAHAIANETGLPFYKISATEVISGVSGASEENIRELFKKAYRTAPSIVFIDEIDAIGSKRENLQREMERRMVTQLMTCMDESHQALGTADSDSGTESSEMKPGYVLVIGATNRPDAVDPALRRPGRFDRELFLGVPDENARKEILSVLTEKLRLDGGLDIFKIARSTPGFAGADLAALVNKAGNLAMRRIIDRRKFELSRDDQDMEWWRRPWAPEEMEKLSISMVDFEEAVKIVQPSSRREGFSSIPNVKWEDVGGLASLRKEFDRYIIQRVKNPEKYEEYGVTLEAGFLLYGPPGCGKTLIAKAVAHEAGANFIHVKGPELLNKYVGESELAVRTIFSRARTCSPCILFFDEVDALTTQRGKDGESVVERLLLQLLIELDGADQRRGVFVIGATNRPEAVDPAVLRPGRLGKVMYVPLPSADERVLILKALAQRKPLAVDVDLNLIGQKEACENFSGADLAALVNEAAMAALEEKQGSIDQDMEPAIIKTSHFEQALGKVSPSVSEKRRNYYEAMSQNFRAA